LLHGKDSAVAGVSWRTPLYWVFNVDRGNTTMKEFLGL
jgi:hypothetical protein